MRIFTLAILLMISANFTAKSDELKISADTNNVMIGDWVNLRLTYMADSVVEFELPVFDSDKVDGVELIEESSVDTTSGSRFGIMKTFTVSAYDSGNYTIPQMWAISPITNDTLYTDSLVLTYGMPAVDTTQAIKDIKDIYSVDYTDYGWLYWVGGIALLLILAGVGYYFYSKREPKEEEPEPVYDPKIPPYILAIESLNSLEQERLWQNGFFKKYYTKMTDILRIYYHRVYDIKTMELTSHELIEVMQEQKLFDSADKEKLQYIAQYSDLSKFAKANPLPENNTKSLEYAKELVEKAKPLSDAKEDGNV
ncbi:MAG: hypothetical protein ACE364_07025 [Chlorobiota bacterium]